METHCAEILYERSEENFIQYKLFIGGKDCSTIRKLFQNMPCGPPHLLVKINWVNHNVKGLGTALREVARNFKCNSDRILPISE